MYMILPNNIIRFISSFNIIDCKLDVVDVISGKIIWQWFVIYDYCICCWCVEDCDVEAVIANTERGSTFILLNDAQTVPMHHNTDNKSIQITGFKDLSQDPGSSSISWFPVKVSLAPTLRDLLGVPTRWKLWKFLEEFHVAILVYENNQSMQTFRWFTWMKQD